MTTKCRSCQNGFDGTNGKRSISYSQICSNSYELADAMLAAIAKAEQK